MLKQLPTTEGDKRREEYFSIFISELRYCNPVFKLGSISYKWSNEFDVKETEWGLIFSEFFSLSKIINCHVSNIN
jgi:hypothetical protein